MGIPYGIQVQCQPALLLMFMSAAMDFGYSRFHGEKKKNGLAADLLAFVPVDIACEINKLTLRNNSDKVKEISLFSYVEFCLWNAVDDMTNYQRNLKPPVKVEIIGSTITIRPNYRRTTQITTAFHCKYFL